MSRKLLLSILCATLLLLVTLPAVGQDAATMSAPIVRSADGKVIISVHIHDFVPGADYRVALGTAAGSSVNAQVTLAVDDQPVGVEATKFSQKNPGQWWGVAQFSAVGFQLSAKQLPAAGKDLVLRAEVDHEQADQLGKLYVFVARDYGSDTWYLEDGSEIDKSIW